MSGSRSGGASRQPSEDDRDEIMASTGNHASPPHPGAAVPASRYGRRPDAGGRQLLSPSSLDDDESARVSPIQVNSAPVITFVLQCLLVIMITKVNLYSVLS